MTGRPCKLFENMIVTYKDEDGRPAQKEVMVKDEVVRVAGTGAKPQVICDYIGVNRDTLRNWLQWGDPDWIPGNESDAKIMPADREPFFLFFLEYRAALAKPAIMSEAAWMQAIRDGDWRAAKEYLKMHRPEEYRDAIDIGVTADAADAMKHALAATREMIEEAQRKREAREASDG